MTITTSRFVAPMAPTSTTTIVVTRVGTTEIPTITQASMSVSRLIDND